MKRELTVSLTGGLGNQLFQYAALLNFGKGREIGLTADFGKPRVQIDGIPELFAYNVGCEIKRFRRTLLSEKFAGYLLRLGVHKKWWEIKPLMRILVSVVGSLYLSFVNRRFIGIRGYSALGYSQEFTIGRSTNLLVGYFQNGIWVGDVEIRRMMMKLSLKKTNSNVQELIDKSKKERPLVVHVRLGDYRKEADFGILPKEYYELAINRAWETESFGAIWLFSDETSDALNKIPRELQGFVRVIDETFSAAESLELMRYGNGYVIANSTFSWWGAMLSYKASPLVIAPKKWFKNLADPENLIPDSWERVRSW